MKITFRFASNLIIAGLIGSVLLGCSSSSKEESSAKEIAFEEAQKRIVSDMDKVIHDLPSPTEVPYMLQATGADFNPDLINDLSMVSNYETDEDKAALNLGVYATDMGYLTSYEQVQTSMEYLEVCQKLAEKIGVASVFDVSTLEKFQNNVSNPDSINTILSEAIIEAEERLEKADRLSVAALILCGSFVEGLYLATMVIDTYPDDVLDDDTRNLILEPLIKVVLDQKKPLLDVIAMLKDLPQDDAIARMIVELSVLRNLYDTDLATIQEKIANNTGNFVLTKEMLVDVTKDVKAVRNKIIAAE